MSRPVPSPSMKGMIGLSGTLYLPSGVTDFLAVRRNRDAVIRASHA